MTPVRSVWRGGALFPYLVTVRTLEFQLMKNEILKVKVWLTLRLVDCAALVASHRLFRLSCSRNAGMKSCFFVSGYFFHSVLDWLVILYSYTPAVLSMSRRKTVNFLERDESAGYPGAMRPGAIDENNKAIFVVRRKNQKKSKKISELSPANYEYNKIVPLFARLGIDRIINYGSCMLENETRNVIKILIHKLNAKYPN